MDKDICEKNKEVLFQIKRRVSDGEVIIPFVGSGLSASFGYPTFRELLDKAKKHFSTKKVGISEQEYKNCYELGEFEDAMGLLCDTNSDIFEEFLSDIFNLSKYRDNQKSRMYALPQLTSKYVITTNFDKCLEGMFKNSAKSFRKVYSKTTLEEMVDTSDLSIEYPVLVKLHGTAGNEELKDRVLTKKDFQKAYFLEEHENDVDERKVDMSKPLPTILRNLAFSGMLLFVGCSLRKHDRIIEIFEKLNACFPIGWHYAIVKIPENLNSDEIKNRTTELGKAGIRPIWFENDNYDDIGKHLRMINKAIPMKNWPNKLSRIVAYNTLDAIQVGSIIRIVSNTSQYRDYSKQLSHISENMKIVIWSMRGSPLNICYSPSNKLTPQDRTFEHIKADYKFRILIFKDLVEANNYKDVKTEKERERKKAFEESAKEGSAELLYASEESLKEFGIEKYLDFGYVEANYDYNLVFCSTFGNPDFSFSKKISDTLREIITFRKNIRLPSPEEFAFVENLYEIQKLIDIIANYPTEPTEENEYNYFDGYQGLYKEIDDLLNYHKAKDAEDD